MATSSAARLGWALVGVQALLFLAVLAGALATGIGPHLPSSIWGGLAVILLGAVALLAAGRQLGKALTPNPVPNSAGLVAHGIYRVVRHPIYLAVLVTCLGVSIAAGTVLAYAALAALVVFFEIKTRLEEKWLAGTYPGYAAYAARTGKFVPGLGKRRP